MRMQKPGSRIARYALGAFGLVLAAMAAGEVGGLKPSEVMASEEVVAVSPTIPPASPKVSPFLATPALEALRMGRSEVMSGTCSGQSPEERFRFENYSDTEWWIYTGGLAVYMYDPDFGVWNCIKAIGAGLEKTTVDWFWYIYESDGQTPLASCFAFDAPIQEDVWDYPYGGGCALNYWDYFDYECVGDEEFHLYYKFNGEQNYTGPLINDDGPYYGCALG